MISVCSSKLIVLSPSYELGLHLQVSHNSGNTPVHEILLKINVRGTTIMSSHNFNILAEMSSGPVDLCMLRLRI